VQVRIGYFCIYWLGMDFALQDVTVSPNGVVGNGYARRHMMAKPERRRHRRLPIKIPLSCSKVGSTTEKARKGVTVNVSPGGLYFQTLTATFKAGSLTRVELSIPPTTGVLELGGTISSFAKVLRTQRIQDCHASTGLSSGKYGVALQFCRPPKLSM
jgi:hypothetical protein